MTALQPADPAPENPDGRRVVVGVDGSESSRHALRWAAYLADATAGTVEAVIAWAPHTRFGVMSTGPGGAPPTGNPAADAQQVLAATIEEVFGTHRPAGLLLSVRQGNPAQLLIEASRSAQLLVVGSRGHGGFAGLLLGSVSAACSAHARCPVVVLHGDTPPPTPSGASALAQ
ncbi:MAG: universal stress protein [Actinomycetota bacterium]|nr:universal stress protein [Actinomycetota bacterium]